MTKNVKNAPASGKTILDEAIRELGLGARAKLLWITFPLLVDFARRFAEYVGPYSITESGASLLQETLSEAFSKHKAEVEQTENDHLGQAIFARTLLSRSKEVFSQQLVVSSDDGDLIWNPFVCSASEFTAKFPGAKVTAMRRDQIVEDKIAQALMLVKLVPPQMLDTETVTDLFNDATITA